MDSSIDIIRRAAAKPKPCATPQEIEEFQRRAGFMLPAPVYDVYTLIGNGGFGPGFRLIGLISGMKDDLGQSALDLYLALCGKSADEPDWYWPRGLLPVCHWGCAIQSCIDCNTADAQVIRFDPHLLNERGATHTALVRERLSFMEWLLKWTRGEELFEMPGTDASRPI